MHIWNNFLARWVRPSTLAALIAAASGAADGGDTSQRPFRVNDLLKIEAPAYFIYGSPYALSKDGKKLAFTWIRARNAWADYRRRSLWHTDHADIWVQADPKGTAVNLTQGEKDDSGWWAPAWSPDGRYLSMLSTRGGNIGLWIWDSANRKMRRLTTRGVALERDLEFVEDARPYVWVDASHLLCATLPQGTVAPQLLTGGVQTMTVAPTEWHKFSEGVENTSDVLDSGVARKSGKRADELLLIDVRNGTAETIAEGSTASRLVAPDARAVALLKEVEEFYPRADETVAGFSHSRYELEIIGMDGKPLISLDTYSRDVLRNSIRWSPDSKEIAFLGYGPSRASSPRLYIVNLPERRTSEKGLGALDAGLIGTNSHLEWTAQGEVLVLAAQHVGPGRATVNDRLDWWLVGDDGEPHNLTGRMSSAPGAARPFELWPQDGWKSFIGYADGNIWRLNTSQHTAENLTQRSKVRVSYIAWPTQDQEHGALSEYAYADPGQTYAKMILAAEEGDRLDFYLLNLLTGSVEPLSKPDPDATLVSYSPSGDAVIYYSGGRNGSFVWRNALHTATSSQIKSANTFLRGIAEAEFKAIKYTSLNGEALTAWVVLPVSYQQGRRYPLITLPYAGWVADGNPPSATTYPYGTIANDSPLNLQIAAARGYAILVPSMPLSPAGSADDAMLRLPDGVMPAVQRAIDLGIADPERLFLLGHSFGGFSVYGLVTETNRFKAAVSMAGISDFVSLYGTFNASDRYGDPLENLFALSHAESGQFRLGNPPWKDLQRYVRNSPIFSVQRVETPLMIVQGDLDYEPIQQGEEFFMSLYRQRKRAEFVRYWGEGHILESPANIRDMWNRVFAWFDNFGDIARDDAGSLMFEGDHVKSRAGRPPLPPEAFARFD
jgi:dipeptidyl aminopeptidase/acylaminoacyl peptidase